MILGAFGAQDQLGNATTFANSGTVTVASFFLAPGGTVTGAGNITVTHDFTWSGGTLTGGGTTTVAQGATLTLSGTGTKTLSGATLNNAGAASWAGGSSFYVTNGAILANQATGTFALQPGVDHTAVVDNLFSNMPATFNNAGLLLISGDVTGFDGLLAFNNSGVVQVQSGSSLQVKRGGGQSSGSFVLAPGTTLALSGTDVADFQYTFTPTSSVTGDGSVAIENGFTTVGGQYNVTHTTIDGTASFTGEHTTATLLIGRTGATLTGSGNVTVTQSFSWQGGAMTGDGTTTFAAGATVTLSPSPFEVTLLDGRTIDNAAAVTWSDFGTGPFYLADGATWINQPAALFDAGTRELLDGFRRGDVPQPGHVPQVGRGGRPGAAERSGV